MATEDGGGVFKYRLHTSMKGRKTIMVLVDYSKGHGYSVLDVDWDEVAVLEEDVTTFKIAWAKAREYTENFDRPKYMEEPVVSFSAVKVILSDFANMKPFRFIDSIENYNE